MNALIVMSYETVRIKSPFIQFFIPLYSGGGLWDVGFFFFFFSGFSRIMFPICYRAIPNIIF